MTYKKWAVIKYECPRCKRTGSLNFPVTEDGFFYPSIPSCVCYGGPVCLVGEYNILEIRPHEEDDDSQLEPQTHRR